MVLSKLSVPGRPTYLNMKDKGLLRLQLARVGLFGHFSLGCFRRERQGIVKALASSSAAASCKNFDIFLYLCYY